MSTPAPRSADAPGASASPARPSGTEPPSADPAGTGTGTGTGTTGAAAGRAAPARRRGGGTAADMVRSLLVIVALVAVVVIAVPRPQGRIQEPVDVPDVVAQARAAQIDVSAPDVPESWTPNLATFRPDAQEGLPTLSVGYVTPEGTYAGLRATRGATPTWTQTVTADGEEAAEDPVVDVEGEPWQRLTTEESEERSSLLLTRDGTTYVVTGTVPLEDLTDVAAQVVPPSS